MEVISDPMHYIIEFVVSIILGAIFGSKIEYIVGIIALVVLITVGISMFHDEVTNPNKSTLTNSTNITNFTNNIMNFTALGINIILSLIFSGAGTTLGVKIRNRFGGF